MSITLPCECVEVVSQSDRAKIYLGPIYANLSGRVVKESSSCNVHLANALPNCSSSKLASLLVPMRLREPIVETKIALNIHLAVCIANWPSFDSADKLLPFSLLETCISECFEGILPLF